MSNKPVDKWKRNGLEFAQWSNGSFSFSKSYKNKDTNKYQETSVIWKHELALIAMLAIEAYLKSTDTKGSFTSEDIEIGMAEGTKAPTKDDDDIPF